MILIDMKMPDCCYRCPACSYLSWWCDAMNKSLVHAISDETGRAEWCPIKELPPHGRLIDADALIAEDWFLMKIVNGVNCAWTESKKLKDVPTIIPASEEE